MPATSLARASPGQKSVQQRVGSHVRYDCKVPVHIQAINAVIQMAVESEEGDIDLLNDETFGDGAVGEW